MSSAISTDPGLRPWQLFLLAGMLAATAVVLVSTGQTMSSVVVLSLTVVTSSLVAMAGYRALSPLVTAPEDEATPVVGRARASLEREKALLLRSLKELEFDHAMGKTATADYEDLRDRLRVRTVGLMRRLDGADYREAIARDLSARSGAATPTTSAASTRATSSPHVDEPRDVDHTVRGCEACRTPNDPDARFCKHCGAPLGAEVS